MKLEPGKFYILTNGDLMRTFMENGRGHMLGAIWEVEREEPEWCCFDWAMNGLWQPGAPSCGLDVCELINSRPSQVSYASQFDYCATYDNDEPDDGGNMRQGFGATELEAVMDLLQAYPGEERAERMRPASSTRKWLCA